MSNQGEIRAAMNRIKTALRQHGCDELVDNLAPGATTEELNAFEKAVGIAIPMDLRELWSIHAGQRTENGYPIRDEDGNGFFGDSDFMGPMDSSFIDGSLEVMREIRSDEALVSARLESGEDISAWRRTDVNSWLESGMSDEEADSDDWLVFAGDQQYDWLVVNAKTGRVFKCLKDAPCMKLAAGSLVEWLTRHAAGVEKYGDPPGR